MENEEHLIPQGSQQSQLTALSPDNQTLQTPRKSFSLNHHLQSCEHCFDELLFLTVNVCFETATRFYQGGEKKKPTKILRLRARSPGSSASPCCLNTCPLTEPTDIDQRPLMKPAQGPDTTLQPETP